MLEIMKRVLTVSLVAALAIAAFGCGGGRGPDTIRIATFHVGDLRTSELRDAESLRAKKLAEVVQELRPDVLLLTHITRDTIGVAGTSEFDPEGTNARRFVETFLSVPQREGLEPIAYDASMPPVNSGRSALRDLDKNGRVVSRFPQPQPASRDGTVAPRTREALDFALDSWGYGEFPGQRGLALLVRRGAGLSVGEMHTFGKVQWASVPGATRPIDPVSGRDYFDFQTWQVIPLFESTAFVAPIEVNHGERFWVAGTFAGPTDHDGADLRATLRRMDGVRFLSSLARGERTIEDDAFRPLPEAVAEEPLVLLADLGIDPRQTPPELNPGRVLTAIERFDGSPVPLASVTRATLDASDTSRDGGRLDYVLVDDGLEVLDAGVYRTLPSGTVAFPSPRFPVWVDIERPD